MSGTIIMLVVVFLFLVIPLTLGGWIVHRDDKKMQDVKEKARTMRANMPNCDCHICTME